jgi:hypothetical protein
MELREQRWQFLILILAATNSLAAAAPEAIISNALLVVARIALLGMTLHAGRDGSQAVTWVTRQWERYGAATAHAGVLLIKFAHEGAFTLERHYLPDAGRPGEQRATISIRCTR